MNVEIWCGIIAQKKNGKLETYSLTSIFESTFE